LAEFDRIKDEKEQNGEQGEIEKTVSGEYSGGMAMGISYILADAAFLYEKSPVPGMDRDAFFVLQVAVCSLLLMTGYLVAFYKKGEATFFALQIVFMILAPLIGPLFFILSWLIHKIFFKKEVNLRELSFRKDLLHSILHPDEEQERNMVPVGEALMISDTQDKRRVMLNVLKGEYEKSLAVISGALENRDTEISHYAASIITEVKSNFKVTVQRMQERLKEYPEDIEQKVMLIAYIHGFLEKKVLSDIEALTYIHIYLELMEEVFKDKPEAVNGLMYRQIICHLLEAGQREDADKWAVRAMQNASGELDTYKGVLKYYYETGNREIFFGVLNRLRESDIVIDRETLDMVRFFT